MDFAVIEFTDTVAAILPVMTESSTTYCLLNGIAGHSHVPAFLKLSLKRIQDCQPRSSPETLHMLYDSH